MVHESPPRAPRHWHTDDAVVVPANFQWHPDIGDRLVADILPRPVVDLGERVLVHRKQDEQAASTAELAAYDLRP